METRGDMALPGARENQSLELRPNRRERGEQADYGSDLEFVLAEPCRYT